jgi:hypothetical protein
MTTAAAIAAAYPRAGLPLAREIVATAARLGTNPVWLAHLINFESAGQFSSSVKNPRSGATGLIQFMPATAKGMGTTTAALSRLTPVQQMRWVESYLRARGSLKTPQALYMAVFYPVAMQWSPTKRFPSWVTKSNPGIYTPGDYVKKVEARARPVSGGTTALTTDGAPSRRFWYIFGSIGAVAAALAIFRNR